MGVSELRSICTESKRLEAVSARESAHTDQASQEAERPLIQPTPRPCFLAPSATTQLYSMTVFRALGESSSESGRVMLLKTRSRPHSQPIDGRNKAHGKPGQAPNERCDQLGPKHTLEGARHREGGIGEQDRRSHEHQEIEYDSPYARDRVYGGEHERRDDERQERECAKQPQPPQAARPVRPHCSRGVGQDQREDEQRKHRATASKSRLRETCLASHRTRSSL